jgi:hypothetical protein
MTTKLRSGKIIDPSMDELSGLFSKKMTFATPKSKKTKLSNDDMFTKMFSKIKIGKSRRKGTLKKNRKTPKTSIMGMDMMGGRRRRSKRSKSKRSKSKRSKSKRSKSKRKQRY